MPEPIQYKDLIINDYEISLTRLTGKPIHDLYGYLVDAEGVVVMKLTKVVFTDGTALGVEGDHDLPYLVEYDTPQPNYDEETLERLYEASEAGEET